MLKKALKVVITKLRKKEKRKDGFGTYNFILLHTFLPAYFLLPYRDRI
jgi:hypothetical protein